MSNDMYPHGAVHKKHSCKFMIKHHYSRVIFVMCISPCLYSRLFAALFIQIYHSFHAVVLPWIATIKQNFKPKLTHLVNFNKWQYNDTNCFLTDRHNKVCAGFFSLLSIILLIECIYIKEIAKFWYPFCGIYKFLFDIFVVVVVVIMIRYNLIFGCSILGEIW